MVGHSNGAILLAHLIQALQKMGSRTRIASVSLFAPAATVKLFETHYRPLLTSDASEFGIDKMNIYNLDEERELDDNVALVYRKSILYLVSNAFEEEPHAPILGMQRFSKTIPRQTRLCFIYSGKKGKGAARTKSISHGGFDNDPATMNDLLRRILQDEPMVPFTPENLKY